AFDIKAVARVLRIKQRSLADKRFSAMGEISRILELMDWDNVPREARPYLESINWLKETFAGKGFLRFPVRRNAGVPAYMTSARNGRLPTNKMEAVLLGKKIPKIAQVWICKLLCRYEEPVFQLLSWPSSSNAHRLQIGIAPFHLTTSMNISGEASIRASAEAVRFCSENGISLLDWGSYNKIGQPPAQKVYFVIAITPAGWEIIRSSDNLPKLP
ncbi:MAG: hypothetical protein ABIJ36_00960, partial [Patescibacteria group bacterium]